MLTNKGFTMIETLFVLVIICILSVLSMLFHQPQKKEKTYISEITQFLYEAKVEAMVSKKTVTIDFEKQKISYSTQDKEKQYQLNQNTSFDDVSFTYNEFGNIKGAKTVIYHGNEKDYRFVYQVGSGSFYVE